MENKEIEEATDTKIISQDAKNLGILNWLGSLIFSFIPSLILYFIKQDDAYVVDQSKEALNWSITFIILSAVASVLTVALIGFLLLPLLGLVHFVFCVMGMLAASKGKPFRTPFNIRLLK